MLHLLTAPTLQAGDGGDALDGVRPQEDTSQGKVFRQVRDDPLRPIQ